jgi:hypothetical protein
MHFSLKNKIKRKHPLLCAHPGLNGPFYRKLVSIKMMQEHTIVLEGALDASIARGVSGLIYRASLDE